MPVGGAGRRARRPSRRTLRLTALAAGVGVVLGLALVTAAQQPLTMSLAWALVLLSAFALISAVLVGIVRTELRSEASRLVDTVAGGMLAVIPPADILHTVFDRVYGPSPHNGDLVTSLLGGAGLAADGSDLTISEHTEIDYRLTRIDDVYFRLVMEVGYTFRRRVPATTFVFFATSDPELRDSIAVGCRQPLFELWFVSEDEKNPVFEDSVESMRESVRLGMRYADSDGRPHEVRDFRPRLREVYSSEWARYLSNFRTDLEGPHQLDRADYLAKLRIFEVDLTDVVAVRSDRYEIRGLSVQSTTIQLLDNNSCYWQAPYPCFVDRVRFDTHDLELGGVDEAVFRVKPFSFRSVAGPLRWATSDEVSEVVMQSWLVPGHGVALMWRHGEETGLRREDREI